MKISSLCECAALLFQAGLILMAAACGDDAMTSRTTDAGAGVADGTDQIPPEGAAKIEAWLKGGAYQAWHCEPDIHASRSPSPHGFNRICSNDAIADNASGTGNWPKGAAAVKELYASLDGKEPVGYAVYLKTEADSVDGANWYWYETVPADSAAPHDATGLVADGLGISGPAKSICVSCHVAAGADAAHTPTAHGRDEVYTPVM